MTSACIRRCRTSITAARPRNTPAVTPSPAPIGVTADGYRRQAPHTVGLLDIVAIQQLYGAPTTGPLTGGQVFGFNTNLTGALRDFYDFTVDTHPVVTLYDRGTGNTLDLSGFVQAQAINLNGAAFSSVAGLTNNLAIALGTQINTVGGSGSGNDTISANSNGDTIDGGGGYDTLSFVAATASVTVSLALAGAQASGGAGTVTLRHVEALTGSTYADTLTGDGGDNTLDGNGGADTLRGGGGKDCFDFSQGGNDIATGGAGNDAFFLGAAFTAAGRVDGGDDADQLGLQGDHTGANAPTLGAAQLVNVETVMALPGVSYRFPLRDDLLAAGKTMIFYAAELTAGTAFTVDGHFETDGKIVDGGGGTDIIYGGPGADTLIGGAGADSYRYISAAHSIGMAHDIIVGFDANADRIDLPFAVAAVDAAVTGGPSDAALDDQLTAALSTLVAYHAVEFTAGAGALAGHVFEVIDANGIAGYQAGQDMAIELQGTIAPITTTTPFV